MRALTKILLVCAGLSGMCNAMQNTACKGHLSSDWYAQNPSLLRSQLQAIDNQAVEKYGTTSLQRVQAMIVPHAGLAYSGSLAAACWRLVKDHNINRVIILASSHYIPFCGALMPTCSKFTLPTGWSLTVDTQCINRLATRKGYFKVDASAVDAACRSKLQKPLSLLTAYQNFITTPFDIDHSLEMQLLFCAYYLPKAKIVPLIIGTVSPEDARIIARELKDCIDHTTLVVVSTDFIHYGPLYDYQPFAKDTLFHDRIMKLHTNLVTSLQHDSLERFMAFVQKKQATVCGKNPLMVFLALVEKQVFEGSTPKKIGDALSDPTGTQPNCVTYSGIVWGQNTSA